MDMEKFLSMVAVETILCHSDSYSMNRNNYRLYHDPATSRFNFLVHGLDWAYSDTGVPIEPPLSSIITRAVIQTPQGRQLYRERVRQLYTNVFRVEVMTNRVNAAVAKLQAAARNTNEAKEFNNYGIEMRNRIVARHRNIAEQIAKPEPKPLVVAVGGTVALAGWKPKEATDRWVQDEPTVDGRSTLHIRAVKGETIASWRTGVLLEEGSYRLQAMARAAQVVALTNAVKLANGAGLRASGEKRTQQLIGDAGWTELEYEFVVEAGGETKELICELRARSGEVWFDKGSLKLIRRK
jgi:hypothetical protein